MNPNPTFAQVGRAAPDFNLASTKDLATLESPVRLSDYAGRWLVLVFYPLDFTFVCPTELRALSERYHDFRREEADVLAVSADSVFCHRAWIEAPAERGGLGPVNYPLASDPLGRVAQAYGSWSYDGDHPLRGTFLIDPKGVLRAATVYDADVGRSVDETLRSLAAFKTGGLCPIDWKPGQATLSAGA